MYSIYYLWCEPTKKAYIGQTFKSVFSRFKEHMRLSKRNEGYAIHHALQKYGAPNFYWCILHENILTRVEADILEIQEIEKCKSLAPTGYNLSVGGTGKPQGMRASPATLSKLSTSAKLMWTNPEYAKKQSDLHKGYKQSDETIKKRMRKSRKIIRCIDLNLTFESGKKAEKWLRDQNKPGAPTYAASGKYH